MALDGMLRLSVQHVAEHLRRICRYYWTNGDVYEGDWQDGAMHGWGKCSFSSGARYALISSCSNGVLIIMLWGLQLHW